MATKKLQAYKTNATKKWIIIDDSAKLTKQDKDDIALYLSAGWTIKHKSEAKAAAASMRAKSDTDATITAALEGDKVAKDEYEKIKGDRGFFAARKFYEEWKKDQKKATGGKKAE